MPRTRPAERETIKISDLTLLKCPGLIVRVDWEVVNGVTGVISAVAAVVSLFFVWLSRLHRDEGKNAVQRPVLAGVLGFVLVSASWIVCVMSFNFVFEPFGSFVGDDEARTLFGIAIGVPALIALRYGVRLMLSNDRSNP